jgi:hypothetical protein
MADTVSPPPWTAEHAENFVGEGPATAQLRAAVRTFSAGAARASSPGEAPDVSVDRDAVGFWTEGLAMGLYLSDDPEAGDRLRRLFAAPRALSMLASVGTGMAAAMRGEEPLPDHSDDPWAPTLPLDGFGFGLGLRRSGRFVTRRATPPLDARALEPFDRGLGRSLWFLTGGDPLGIVPAIARFPEPRRAALWRGVGVASTYAGTPDVGGYLALATRAGEHASAVREGSRTGAALRLGHRSRPPHLDAAERVFGPFEITDD